MGKAIDLAVGQVLGLSIDSFNGLYRVFFLNRELDMAALFPLQAFASGVPSSIGPIQVGCKSPEKVRISWLESLSPGECSVVQLKLPAFASLPTSALSSTQLAKARMIRERTQRLITPDSMHRLLFSRSYSGELEKLANELGVHRTTLGRDLGRYCLCDCDAYKAGVFGALAGQPADPKQRRVSKKLGRKKKAVKSGHLPEDEGINVNAEILERLRLFLLAQGDRNKLTPAALFGRWRKSIKIEVTTLASGLAVTREDPRFDISENQFRQRLKQLESERERTRALIGEKNFLKDVRPLIGTARDWSAYPGQCYLIDSTVADVYLVSAQDRTLLVGRPTVYVVIDVFSSVILAVHVTLEASSLRAAQVALFRAVTDKTILLSKLQMPPELISALPQGCKPQSIFADRAELLSEGGRQMADLVDVAESFSAPYRADWKSLVERYFKTQNDLEIHWIPGAVRERARERGSRDVRHDAQLTVNEFLRILLAVAAEWNISHNMKRVMTVQMLQRGVAPNPLAVWRYGLEHLHGSPMYPASRQEALSLFVPPIPNATVSREGVRALEGLRYTASWMRDDDRFFAMMNEKKVEFRVDPDLPTMGYVFDRKNNELRSLELVDVRNHGEFDTSLDDIRCIEDYTDLLGREAEGNKKIPISTLQTIRDDQIRKSAQATKRANQGSTVSKTKKVANIKGNRQLELLRMKGVKLQPHPDLGAEQAREVAASRQFTNIFDAWSKESK